MEVLDNPSLSVWSFQNGLAQLTWMQKTGVATGLLELPGNQGGFPPVSHSVPAEVR